MLVSKTRHWKTKNRHDSTCNTIHKCMLNEGDEHYIEKTKWQDIEIFYRYFLFRKNVSKIFNERAFFYSTGRFEDSVAMRFNPSEFISREIRKQSF